MDTGVKKKPKKPLTPLQQNRLLKIILGLVVVSALWILFCSRDWGVQPVKVEKPGN